MMFISVARRNYQNDPRIRPEVLIYVMRFIYQVASCSRVTTTKHVVGRPGT